MMKSSPTATFVAAAAALLLPLTALAADGTFEKTLQVSGPVLLGLDNGSGNVHISAGPVNTVHIVGHVHGSNGWMSGGDATARVQQVVSNPPITQAGNIISIGRNFHVNNISIDYEITTPRGTDLRVATGSGDVQDNDTGGPTELKTGSGDIVGHGLSDRVSLETGSGTISVDLLSARDVKAQTGSGDITLKNVQGTLWAQTGSGSLDVSGHPMASGWKVETGSGDVKLDTGGAPLHLDASTGSGDISYTGGNLQQTGTFHRDHVIGDAHGGGPLVRIQTGSGSIHVQ